MSKEVFFSRKAQITLIVIVGIVLVIVFALMLSLRKSVQAKEAFSVNKVISEIESGLVKDHITSCVYKVASDGIERAGANGGLIYDFEGGKIPLANLREGIDYLNYSVGPRTFLVAYGLRENSFCPIINYSVPEYPVAGASFSDFPILYSQNEQCLYNHSAAVYDGFFGQSSMPKLCTFIENNDCKAFAKGAVIGFAIQRQLEDYLSAKLPLCVDLEGFGEQFDAQISQDGPVRASVSVRDSDIQISVDFPFKITFRNSEPISRVFQYQSAVKARLGALYNFVYDTVSRDSKDPYFNLTRSAPASSYFRPGFEFRKISNPCRDCALPQRYDDIIEVFDSQSIVNGRPLLFRSAFQERMPALELVPDYEYEVSHLDEGQVYQTYIPFAAIDPDDTRLTYYFLSEGYEGWREDDNVFFYLENDTFLRVVPLFSTSDLGTHRVALLAVDEAGLFDYQNFTITVTDHDYTGPAGQNCLNDCSGSGQACDEVCWIAANPCASVCRNDYYGSYVQGSPEYDECRSCTLRIYYSEADEDHAECEDLSSKDACAAQEPDCFWVVRPDYDGQFRGYCYNDRDLNLAPHPAYIIK